MTRPQSCAICGEPFRSDDRLVLVFGRLYEEYCSEACLRQAERRRRNARAVLQGRWLLGAAVLVSLLTGANLLWQRFIAPRPRSISYDPPEFRPKPATGPNEYGPAWPPTDDEWLNAFRQASWIYPLPGPVRRQPAVDRRIFEPEPSKGPRPMCRTPGRCSVDLGGELWGEHVYAVLDGVVDRVQRAYPDDRPGLYIRLSHFGGMVFTHYFHLAAVPRTIVHGMSVRAGEMIGLVGDTGLGGTPRHLTFALSVKPANEFAEVYWDPVPLMMLWRLRSPPRGSVAGFMPEKEIEPPPHRHPR
jgi:hypothetical protein